MSTKFSVKFLVSKSLVLFTFCLLFVAAPVYLAAQSTAQEIEDLLEQRAVTYSQAARFILDAADVASIADPVEAFRFAEERNWLPRNSSSGQLARLDGLSLLIMRAFNLRGGVMYTLTGAPRYAYRELVYNGIIQGRATMNMHVSGYELLFIINRVLSQTERRFGWDLEVERRSAEREVLVERINRQFEELRIADTVATVTNEGVTIIVYNIPFQADSAELPELLLHVVQEIGGIIRDISRVGILVGGHTALAGTEESMLEVSYARARGVADYLVSIGAGNASEVMAVGYGADRPIASNETAEGRAANRRVEITIIEN